MVLLEIVKEVKPLAPIPPPLYSATLSRIIEPVMTALPAPMNTPPPPSAPASVEVLPVIFVPLNVIFDVAAVTARRVAGDDHVFQGQRFEGKNPSGEATGIAMND